MYPGDPCRHRTLETGFSVKEFTSEEQEGLRLGLELQVQHWSQKITLLDRRDLPGAVLAVSLRQGVGRYLLYFSTVFLPQAAGLPGVLHLPLEPLGGSLLSSLLLVSSSFRTCSHTCPVLLAAGVVKNRSLLTERAPAGPLCVLSALVSSTHGRLSLSVAQEDSRGLKEGGCSKQLLLSEAPCSWLVGMQADS